MTEPDVERARRAQLQELINAARCGGASADALREHIIGEAHQVHPEPCVDWPDEQWMFVLATEAVETSMGLAFAAGDVALAAARDWHYEVGSAGVVTVYSVRLGLAISTDAVRFEHMHHGSCACPDANKPPAASPAQAELQLAAGLDPQRIAIYRAAVRAGFYTDALTTTGRFPRAA